jgi:hypothetical protein
VQKYPVRTSARTGLTPENLEALCRTHFDRAERNGSSIHSAWGALAALTVSSEGKELAVEVTMNPKVTPEVAAETVRRYNEFLQAATGFTAKERASRLRKSATKGGSGA